MPFVDRDHELRALEELWGMRPQVALLWGRRRVGKTRLIQQFAEGKAAITYQADEGTATEQLARLTDRILAYSDDPLLRAQPLANWDAAIAVLLRLAREAKAAGHALLVVLDEFPRLVVATPRLPSLLQAALEDVRRDDLPLYLVLAGSQIGLFEQHVLLGPIYGRRTWGEQLPPLGYREAGQFFPGWAAADRLRAWALLGGIPYYLEQWDPARSLEWNVVARLLRKGTVLYGEAELMLKEELGRTLRPTCQSSRRSPTATHDRARSPRAPASTAPQPAAISTSSDGCTSSTIVSPRSPRRAVGAEPGSSPTTTCGRGSRSFAPTAPSSRRAATSACSASASGRGSTSS